MRLLMVGQLGGEMGSASRMAMDAGADVFHAAGVEEALTALRNGQGADLVMIDVTLDVGAFARSVAAERMHLTLVACGITDDANAAVRAIKAGAKEYIPLPPEPELIAAVIAAVAGDQPRMVVRDPAMLSVVTMAERVAKSDASVLITGPSGTGKEVLARHVHACSPRKAARFVSVNCAAIPENLLESELFGHEKGAFTGAVARRLGRFEEAHGGTLLLDEISEMDARLQAKLLRALQERVIDRVGGSKPVPVDIRVIATSNRDLAAEVARGTFREDLLYRLNVVNLTLPALADRPDDIRALATHFAQSYAEKNGLDARPLSDDAMEALLTARWPGNVRELENTIHRAILLAQGDVIDADAIVTPSGEAIGAAPFGTSTESARRAAQTAESVTRSFVGRTVGEVEKDLILDTLDHCLGNRTHAANILGISIRTLRNKLRQYADEGAMIPGPGEMRGAA